MILVLRFFQHSDLGIGDQRVKRIETIVKNGQSLLVLRLFLYAVLATIDPTPPHPLSKFLMAGRYPPVHPTQGYEGRGCCLKRVLWVLVLLAIHQIRFLYVKIKK